MRGREGQEVVFQSAEEKEMTKDAHKVITSGFSFSGSSAVLDFLLDHEGVVRFPGGEFRMIRHNRGFARLEKFLRLKGKISAKSLKKFHEYCKGEFPVKTASDEAVKRNILILRKVFRGFYSKQVKRFISSIKANPTCEKTFIESTQCFVSSLCNEHARKKNARIVVIDQGVRPWAMNFLSYYDNATVCVTLRDVRDQYIDRLRHGLESSHFPDEMLGRMERYVNAKTELFDGKKHKLLEFWFEDFVFNQHGARARVKKQFRLKAKGAEIPKFNPVASARNVFQYEKRPDLVRGLDGTYSRLYYRKPNRVLLKLHRYLDRRRWAGVSKQNKAGAFSKTRPLRELPYRD